MHRTLTAALLLTAAITAAPAQDLTHKAPAQSHPVFITGATVHTVSGDTIDNGVVAFDQGVITIVGRADDIMPRIRLADTTEIFDATGMHLYPAIFAANSQMGLTEISAVRAMDDYDEVGNFSPEVRAAVSVNPDSTLIPVARSNGVLLFASLPTGGRVPGRASVMRADGWTSEDMTIDDHAALCINWPRVRPQYDRFNNKPASERMDDIQKDLDAIDAMFDAAEDYARAGDDAQRKDLRYDAMLPYLPPSPRRGEGRGEGSDQKPLLIAADDVDQITSAVTWAAGRNLKVIILGGRDAPLCAQLLVDHDVPVIVNGTHVFPKRTDAPHDDPFTLPKRLEDAGVTWCLAPSDRNANERNLPYEAARAAAFGLSPDAALRSITLAPAQILGVDDDYGSIEQGKSATLFLADGDCLEITSNVTAAFIDGKRIDLSNKQTKLRDKYEDKYQQLGIIEKN